MKTFFIFALSLLALPVLADEIAPPEAPPLATKLMTRDVITVPQSAARRSQESELALPEEKFESFPLAPRPDDVASE